MNASPKYSRSRRHGSTNNDSPFPPVSKIPRWISSAVDRVVELRKSNGLTMDLVYRIYQVQLQITRVAESMVLFVVIVLLAVQSRRLELIVNLTNTGIVISSRVQFTDISARHLYQQARANNNNTEYFVYCSHWASISSLDILPNPQPDSDSPTLAATETLV